MLASGGYVESFGTEYPVGPVHEVGLVSMPSIPGFWGGGPHDPIPVEGSWREFVRSVLGAVGDDLLSERKQPGTLTEERKIVIADRPPWRAAKSRSLLAGQSAPHYSTQHHLDPARSGDAASAR